MFSFHCLSYLNENILFNFSFGFNIYFFFPFSFGIVAKCYGSSFWIPSSVKGNGIPCHDPCSFHFVKLFLLFNSSNNNCNDVSSSVEYFFLCVCVCQSVYVCAGCAIFSLLLMRYVLFNFCCRFSFFFKFQFYFGSLPSKYVIYGCVVYVLFA